MKMTFARPNKLDFDGGQVRITSDGTTLTTTVVPLKRYTTMPAPKTLGIDAFREGPIGAMIFGRPGGPVHVCFAHFTDGRGSGGEHRSIRGHAASSDAVRRRPESRCCKRRELDNHDRIRQRKDRAPFEGRSGHQASVLDRDEA